MKVQELHCHYCGSALVHYRMDGKYVCDKCYEKINKWGEEYFNSPVVPGGFIKIQNRGKVNHSWRDFGKKSRQTKKEKIKSMAAEAELIL